MANLKSLIPDFVKPVLRPIRDTFVKMPIWRRATSQHKSREELHQYWKAPRDSGNVPQAYLEGEARSQFLVKLIQERVQADARILEIGCNIGRNLNCLHRAGFQQLSGIEINENAVRLLRQHFPDMAQSATIYNTPIEDIIRTFRDDEFDVVYTMAVLEHIHSESEWIFAEMKRIARGVLITIEDERDLSWRHFPRNYQLIFEALGLKQVEQVSCQHIEGLGANFVARVFVKSSVSGSASGRE